MAAESVKDFRNYNPRIDPQQQLDRLKKRLILICALGFPFVIAAAVAVPAYFGDNAIFPFLENKQTAFLLLMIGGVGLAIESIFSFRTIAEINKLKQETQNERTRRP